MKAVKLWLPVVLWASLIYHLSSIPSLHTGLSYDFILRKTAHVGEYLVLTLLLKRAFENTFSPGFLCSVVLPAAAAILYAISDEVHQLSVHGRSGSAQDVLIDCLGIAGLLLLARSYKKKPS